MRPVLALALVITVLNGCSGDGEGPEEPAAELAAALSQGSLPASLFVEGSPQTAYDAVTEGMGDQRPSVEVTDVAERDGSAEATLQWSWQVGGARWTYDSTV